MKKVSTWSVIVIASFILTMMCVPVSLAQGSPDAVKGAWSLGVPEQIVTQGFTGQEAIVAESGKVIKIERVAGMKNWLLMRLKTDQGSNYAVYMGPNWFVENQKVKFAVGDMVEVRGKKFLSNIIATEISKGNWTMKLRNEEDGQPNWECCFPRKEKKEQ